MNLNQTSDLEVRVRIPIQVQIFILKFMKFKSVLLSTLEGATADELDFYNRLTDDNTTG